MYRDKTLVNKIMYNYIPNDDTQITLSVDYNKLLKHEPTNPNPVKVPKLVKPTNKETLNENFGDK